MLLKDFTSSAFNIKSSNLKHFTALSMTDALCHHCKLCPFYYFYLDLLCICSTLPNKLTVANCKGVIEFDHIYQEWFMMGLLSILSWQSHSHLFLFKNSQTTLFN